MGTTAECDSLVLCGTHLHRVSPAFSVQGDGHSLRQIALVSLTTGENIKWYSQHNTLHMYSIMCVECLQYFSDNNTCQIQGLIPFSHYSVASTWLPEESNRLGWNHSNIYTTQRTHMLTQQNWVLLLNNNRPKSRLIEGQSEKHNCLYIICYNFQLKHVRPPLGEVQNHTLHVSAFTSLRTKTTLTCNRSFAVIWIRCEIIWL